MKEIIERVTALGVIPVIKLDRAADAVPLAKALRDGGLKAAEVTFRTDAAEEAIRLIAKEFPDFLVIAGTVLTTLQAEKAMQAGAQAIVSPGLNPTVVKYCRDKGYPVIPGVVTPTEVESAMSFGLTHVKFFPAEAAGGVKMISAMSAPYGNIRFMPTGGVSVKNLADYLNCKAVFACGGTWMVPADKINAGEFDAIRDMTAEAVKLVKEIRGE